jgi:RNA polymerase sigma-70 factor (ECF subfamily)
VTGQDGGLPIVSVQSELSPTVVRWALDGNRAAMDHLLTIAHTVAVRYCRARIGRRDGSFADTDRRAYQACLAAVASLREVPDRDVPFLTMVYRSAAAVVDRNGRPHDGAMTPASRIAELVATFPVPQRETLVLRTIVGRSTVQVAQTLGWRIRTVRDVESQPLARLRALLPAR